MRTLGTVSKRNYAPRKRYFKKKYALASQVPKLYPSLYDSLLMYFNYSITFTQAVNTQGAFIGAYLVESFQALVNLRPYFGQYRVEKVTLSLSVAESATFNQIHMATTHSADGAVVGGSTPTLISIRSYRDWQVFSPNQNVPKKTWRMDTNDVSECNYYDVPSAVINANSQFVCGGVQFFSATDAAGGAIPAIQAEAQFKVRLKGKQAIAT